MAGVKENTRLALYRKYRPTSFEQVIGQPQVTDVLKAAVKNSSFAHAYLFTGQRGTGKTTVARILAHAINNLDYSDNINSSNVDIIEIDAASNNGVDDVREIRNSVQLVPMNCTHKVYIIDEFHMLSKPAFNALLKTIEEPPEYVVFILATTELQKVPATILSRVQRFHFKPLKPELLTKHLRFIADQEKITITDEALQLIAKSGGGSVRDSITLLDQLSSNKSIDVTMVNDVLGLVSNEQIDDIITATTIGNYPLIIKNVQAALDNGTSPSSLAGQIISRAEEIALSKHQPEIYQLIDRLLEVSKSSLPSAKLLATLINFNCQPASKNLTNMDKVELLEQKKTESKIVTTATASAKLESKEKAYAEQTKAITSEAKAIPEVKPTLESSSASANSHIDSLDWQEILEQLSRQDRPSIRSLLEQCDYRYTPDRNTLTLYFSKAFHRKQAETKLFYDALMATFQELYDLCPIIEISKEKVPADSDIATVLNFVGGEVTTITDGTI